ncbi:hypothetical protein D3C71_1049900 [compost metagenome]
MGRITALRCVDDDGEIIRCFDAQGFGGAGIPLCRPVRPRTIFKGCLDIFRLERLAVMEHDAFAQFDLKTVRIKQLDVGCQFVDDRTWVVELHWRAGEETHHETFDVLLRQCGVSGRVPVAGDVFSRQEGHRLASLCKSRRNEKVRIDLHIAGDGGGANRALKEAAATEF